MSYTKWVIKHTPFINNKWEEANEVTLSSYHDPQIRVLLGEGRDNFSFKITNFNGTSNNKFNPNDKITISRVLNSTTVGTDDIEIVGTIKNVPQTVDSNNDLLKIEGYNFSESVMSALVFVDLKNQTIDEGLKLAVENATGKNKNFQVTWSDTNPSSISTSTSTPFPTITSEGRYFNKPVKKVLEKYSTNTSTDDGTYYWYVNNENELIWRHQNDVKEYSFNTGTDEHKAIKIGKDLKGIRNYIILKGGYDPQGNQIQTRYPNWASISTNGMKFHFLVSENNNCKNLVYNDLLLDYGEANIGNNSYPKFSFTSTWISADTGTVVTAANEDEYIAVVRAHIKAALLEEGRRVTETLQYGKLQMDVTFRANQKNWGLGDKITCTVPTIRDNPFILRVSEKAYGEFTDIFTLEEDEGTLGKGEEE